MIFSEYVENETKQADMLDESIYKVGPDFEHGKYRANHLETNRHDTRVQHFRNGSFEEVLMQAKERRERLKAGKIAQKKRDNKMELIQRKRRLRMMQRRIMNLKQQPDIKLPIGNKT